MAGTLDQFEWLVNFSARTLPPVRVDGWEKVWGAIREELAKFCGPQGDISAFPPQAPASETELLALHEDVKRLVAPHGKTAAVRAGSPVVTVNLSALRIGRSGHPATLLLNGPTWRATAL